MAADAYLFPSFMDRSPMEIFFTTSIQRKRGGCSNRVTIYDKADPLLDVSHVADVGCSADLTLLRGGSEALPRS